MSTHSTEPWDTLFLSFRTRLFPNQFFHWSEFSFPFCSFLSCLVILHDCTELHPSLFISLPHTHLCFLSLHWTNPSSVSDLIISVALLHLTASQKNQNPKPSFPSKEGQTVVHTGVIQRGFFFLQRVLIPQRNLPDPERSGMNQDYIKHMAICILPLFHYAFIYLSQQIP